MGLPTLNLADLLVPERSVALKAILDEFSCPLNEDVEDFLKYKAVEFSKQRIAATYLVTKQHEGDDVIVGYFSIAQKFFHLRSESKDKLNSKLRRKVDTFGEYMPVLKGHMVSAILIGQLGKNYAHDYDKLISGAELLKIACDTVAEVQRISSGKMVYVECEDKPALVEFYKANGFRVFDNRPLDRDETDGISGDYLVQLMKSL